MKSIALAAGLALAATAAFADAEKYTLDSSHSQVMFTYQHLGFSTTYGMFSGFAGTIMFDEDAPEASSVTVSIPVKSMFTGWEAREGHFFGPDFLNAQDGDVVTFTSTAIEVTGESTANITGDLTIQGTTKSVVLDAKLNQAGENPLAGKPWLGFDASTSVLRSDFGMGAFAPAVSDEVRIMISVEAQKAE
ncbi:YceI family protein [Litoreibacter sp.]|nr:YceI family protein [Litoreibacter sp.]